MLKFQNTTFHVNVIIKKCNILRKLQYCDIRMTYMMTISGDFWTYYNPGMTTKHAEMSHNVFLEVLGPFWIAYYSFSHRICFWYKSVKLVILCAKFNSKEPHICGSSMLFVCDYDVPWKVCYLVCSFLFILSAMVTSKILLNLGPKAN